VLHCSAIQKTKDARFRLRALTRKVLVCSLFATLLASAGCSTEESSGADSPVLLIGVDGLEWRIILEMIEEGQLPVLERLMREGSFGKLGTLNPTWSPVIWTTVATGKMPQKHGILGFTLQDKGEVRLFSNRDRRTKALWNIFSDFGRTVHTVGWWMTFPAEEISGTMVAQTNTLAQLERQSGRGIWKGTVVSGLPGQITPPAFHDPVMDIGADVQQRLPELALESLGELKHPLRGIALHDWENGLWSFRADTIYSRVSLEILSSEDGQPFDLMMVYFGGPDVYGHRFWRYAYPEEFEHPPSEEELENFAPVIWSTYRYVDASIGKLLDSVDGSPTVFVVSDHGMHAANQDADFTASSDLYSGNHDDTPPGVLIAHGKHVRRSPGALDRVATSEDLPLVGRVLDVATSILALKGLPLGRDMDGVILDTVLEKEFFESHPPKYVETHDTGEWLESRPRELLSREAEQERLEQLRALGYLQ